VGRSASCYFPLTAYLMLLVLELHVLEHEVLDVLERGAPPPCHGKG
jgi:hypothetical protein